MKDKDSWSLVFYVEENGNTPIQDFLLSLDAKTQARFEWSIERLRVTNVFAREPLVKHLTGKIWELREESKTNIYRLLYFFYTGKRIVFLHGFQKKSQKTPSKEIEIAVKRMQRYVDREGGES